MLTVLRVITSVGSIYLLLILIRVLLTWFHGVDFGRPYQILCSLTDPYLNYFRRFKRLRGSVLDFSPIVAVLVLIVLLDLLNRIMIQGRISLGIVLGVLLSAVWSAISFVLTLCIVLIVIRFVMSISGANSVGPFVRTLDTLVAPLLEGVRKRLFKNRFVTHKTILATTGAIILALYIALSALMAYLIPLIHALPV